MLQTHELGAVRAHHDIFLVVAHVPVGVGEDAADFRPFNVELFGNQHGDSRNAALPHFGMGNTDGDETCRVDGQPRVDLNAFRHGADGLGQRHGGLADGNMEAEHQPAACGSGRLHELAAREVGSCHDRRPSHRLAFLAARWTACRIRWYVPQRQILPESAASISRSDGSRRLDSKAAADMICPD